jgi:hypothetical protein
MMILPGSAKQAFFHPSMLPLLYFPDEHVYAVYASLRYSPL